MIRITALALTRMQRYLEACPEIATKAAVLSLNRIGERDAPKFLRAGIEEETAFPEGYVQPRIALTRKAYHNSLEVVLTARHRPTSLARFARGQAPGGRAGVRVTVNPGAPVLMKRAFLIRLRAGKQLTDESFNLGLAIRLKKGEKIEGKTTSVSFAGGLALIYGPSVNQVMREVADSQAPPILDALDSEFLRQFSRLSEKF